MRPSLLIALLLGCLMFAAGPVAAGDPPPDHVKITVAVILANGDGKVDEHVKCVAREVRKSHPKLTGYHVGPTLIESVPLDGSKTFKLVDGQEAKIRVKRCADCPGRFCLVIESSALFGEMAYDSVCGKYFPLVTGYKTKDHGDQVILAFKVESCAGKEKDKK